MQFFRLLLTTDGTMSTALLRITLGIVIFPHGAEKVFPVFGGKGFSATLQGMNEHMGIPVVFVVLAIAAEFFGSIALLVGFLTRAAALGVACVMTVAIWMVHLQAGFFMNWGGQPGKPEGFEYHILVLGICLALVLRGAGRWSIDRLIAKGTNQRDDRFPVRA
jgi:putative oxidoreductase